LCNLHEKEGNPEKFNFVGLLPCYKNFCGTHLIGKGADFATKVLINVIGIIVVNFSEYHIQLWMKIFEGLEL